MKTAIQHIYELLRRDGSAGQILPLVSGAFAGLLSPRYLAAELQVHASTVDRARLVVASWAMELMSRHGHGERTTL